MSLTPKLSRVVSLAALFPNASSAYQIKTGPDFCLLYQKWSSFDLAEEAFLHSYPIINVLTTYLLGVLVQAHPSNCSNTSVMKKNP